MKKTKCAKCGKVCNTKRLSKVEGENKLFCNVCTQRLRKAKRLKKFGHLIDKPQPRKRSISKKQDTAIPKIKDIRKTIRVNSYGISLTIEEKQLLFRKYKKSGMDYEEANQKVKGINNHLKDLVKKLREQKKSDEQINKRFLEELEKYAREN